VAGDTTTNPIAPTSRWMAAARAWESERADRLFDDPLAAALSGPKGFAWLECMEFAAQSVWTPTPSAWTGRQGPVCMRWIYPRCWTPKKT
jgi:O-methyltransferase involved in polyketide biosynthesis